MRIKHFLGSAFSRTNAWQCGTCLFWEGRQGGSEGNGAVAVPPDGVGHRWVRTNEGKRTLWMRRVDNSGDKGGGQGGTSSKQFCKSSQGLFCKTSSPCPRAGPAPALS